MKNYLRSLFLVLTISMLGFAPVKSIAQCFQLYDGFGVLSSNPYYIGCSGNDFTIYIQANMNLGSYIIDWGDGSPNSTGSSLIVPNFVTHTYTATVDTFIVTVTDLSTGCTVSGVVVLEEPVNASIQIPLGGVTVVCAPHAIDFINSSTNVSPTTTFTWDFGDGTPPLTFGPGNAGQTISHTYQKNTVSCETVVTLTAENYCSMGNPTVAQFYPLMVYDVDTAAISASATLLCYPDTVVHFENATMKNCVPEGNIDQRYEYWNFGDLWGLGYDSIIPWVPFDPPARPGYTIAFPGIGSYTIMMIDSNMCGQDTAYITITIVPPPQASLSYSSDSICQGETVTIQTGNDTSANSFFWNFGNGNFVSLPGGNQSVTFSDTGLQSIYYVTGIAGGTGSCTDTAQLDLYVKPSPDAVFSLDYTEGCDSLSVQISDSTSGAVSWDWDFGNGSSSTLSNPPMQTYSSPGEYEITLAVTHNNGCVDTTSNQVTIYESPVAGFMAFNTCEQTLATFLNTSTADTSDTIVSCFWDFGDGSTDSTHNGANTYAASGTYNVTLVVNTAHCADSSATTITIEPKPTAAFSINNNASCSPFQLVTTNLSANAVNYNWDFGDGGNSTLVSPAYTYINNDTNDTSYMITMIASTAFGCTDTAVIPVTVYGSPIADFVSNASPDCGPITINFTNQSAGATNYYWDFGDSTAGSNLTDPSHVFNNTTLFITNYDVQLVAENAHGCLDTTVQTVTVYPEPNFTFSTIPDSGCAPLTVSFPAVVGAVSYNWDFGDGTTATGQMPTHTFLNNTTNNQQFTVTLIGISPFGCADTTTETVTVFPIPTASFSMIDSIGCTPVTVTFSNNSTSANSYHWDFGNGDTSNTSTPVFTHTFSNNDTVPLTFDVDLIAQTIHGCNDTTTRQVTVYPPVQASFTGDTAGCSPLAIQFNNQSSGATSSFWDFGNGNFSNTTSPSHVFSTGSFDTVYTVQLAAVSPWGCADTVDMNITVYHRATSNSFVSSVQGCTPLDVTFYNNSTDFDNILWDFGDGHTTSNPATQLNHTFINQSSTTNTYTVELIASTMYGCNDTSTLQVEVFPPVIADFTSDTAGCSPLYVPFTNTSTGGYTYQWYFGNGSTSTQENPDETFSYTGSTDTTYSIQLITTSAYGCSDTTSGNITVYPAAAAGFLANPLTQVYPSTTVTFTNTTNGQWTYNWTFGNGMSSTLQHPGTIDYDTTGTYVVTLIIQNPYCSDTTTQTVEILPPPPVASFFGSGEGCAPLTISFVNNSEWATNYQWEFGDGNTAVTKEPTYTYYQPGTYTVTLIATGPNGQATMMKVDSVIVHPNALARFEFKPEGEIVTGDPVYFMNLSVHANSYEWDFGDGHSSTEEFPVHEYETDGQFEVTLIANNEFNCPDTFRYPTVIPVKASGEITFPNAFIPSPHGPNGGYYEKGSTENHIFHPVSQGVVAYHLTIYNRWGELIFESFDVYQGWDGYYRGQLSPQDAYVFKAVVTLADGTTKTIVGDVTLIR